MNWVVHPTKPVVYTDVQLPPEALEGVEITRNNRAVIVHHNQKSYELLRSRGVLIPPPVARYTYPGRFPPMQHQIETVEFLVNNPRCCCTDPIGSGKTNSALWAMDYLISQGCVRRVLIISPISVRGAVWHNELMLALPQYPTAILEGSRKRKQTIVEDNNLNILLGNPDSLHIIKDHTKDIDLIIFDEANDIKTARTRRWKSLRDIANGKRLWLMTGTPTPQAPTDAHGLYKLIADSPKPYGFVYFRDITMRQVNKFRWIPRGDAPERVAELLQPCIGHTPQQCSELPEISIINREVSLTAEQEKVILQFKREAQAQIEGEDINAFNAAAVITKTLQVMAGGVYNTKREVKKVEAEPLFGAVEGIIREADTPVLVFVAFRSSLTSLVSHLNSSGFRVADIHGGTPPNERTQTFAAFQAGALDVIVAVASAMSHGVTLTRGRVVVWVTPPSSSVYTQANGRVYRKGQKSKVLVYNLIQHKLVAALYDRIRYKTSQQETVLDLLRSSFL